MAILFTTKQIPDLKKGRGHLRTVARACSLGTYKIDDISKLISSRSSLSPADAKSALDSFSWVIQYALSQGINVYLDGIGSFSPSLKTKGTDGDRFAVEVNGINFRCNKQLLKGLQSVGLKRNYQSEKAQKRVDEKDWTEEVIQVAKQYGYMSPNLYCSLVGCSRFRATKEMKKYVERGILVREGRGSHTIYLLANPV